MLCFGLGERLAGEQVREKLGLRHQGPAANPVLDLHYQFTLRITAFVFSNSVLFSKCRKMIFYSNEHLCHESVLREHHRFLCLHQQNQVCQVLKHRGHHDLHFFNDIHIPVCLSTSCRGAKAVLGLRLVKVPLLILLFHQWSAVLAVLLLSFVSPTSRTVRAHLPLSLLQGHCILCSVPASPPLAFLLCKYRAQLWFACSCPCSSSAVVVLLSAI